MHAAPCCRECGTELVEHWQLFVHEPQCLVVRDEAAGKWVCRVCHPVPERQARRRSR